MSVLFDEFMLVIVVVDVVVIGVVVDVVVVDALAVIDVVVVVEAVSFPVVVVKVPVVVVSVPVVYYVRETHVKEESGNHWEIINSVGKIICAKITVLVCYLRTPVIGQIGSSG